MDYVVDSCKDELRLMDKELKAMIDVSSHYAHLIRETNFRKNRLKALLNPNRIKY